MHNAITPVGFGTLYARQNEDPSTPFRRELLAKEMYESLRPVDAVRYRDVIHTPVGDYTVCRVVDEDDGYEHYVCTNGTKTKIIHSLLVDMGNVLVSRDGVRFGGYRYFDTGLQ